jgi:hypothetical protein
MRKDEDILKQQKLHRGKAREFLMNFTRNISTYGRLMRHAMQIQFSKPNVFQASMRSYVIAIAACLETYFRDFYIHMLEQNPQFLTAALERIPGKEALATLHRSMSSGMSFPDFALSRVAFRSAEEIDANLSIFVRPYGFLDTLDDYELVCGIPSIPGKHMGTLQLGVFCPDWRKNLARIFELRHEFAHDANSKTELDTQEMESLERSAVILPQVAAYMYLFRTQSGGNDGNVDKEAKPVLLALYGAAEEPLPVILMISDLVSEDWQVTKNPEEMKKLRETKKDGAS